MIGIKKSLALAAVSAAAMFAGSTAASAAVVLCTGSNCTATDENVLVDAASGVASITGSTNNTGQAVLFTSPTDPLLIGNANGQADISSVDGLLNGLKFELLNGATFASATFNLFPLPGNQSNEATSVIVTYFDPLAGVYGSQTISTNGQNFLGISGTAGERFTGVQFVGNPSTRGVQDLRQLRLGGVAAVPEPATWAMMLVGFGGIGYSMRRRPSRRLVQAV
jgi:hypothetical protein